MCFWFLISMIRIIIAFNGIDYGGGMLSNVYKISMRKIISSP